MRWLIYALVVSLIFALGWKSNESWSTKKELNQVRIVTEKSVSLQAKHAKERSELEKQITDSGALATRQIKKLAEENSQLKMQFDSTVDSAGAIYARLCDQDSECALLRDPADSPAQGERISVLSLLYVIRKMDEAVERNNFVLEQHSQQLKVCYGSPRN